jgi:hypothetical protein
MTIPAILFGRRAAITAAALSLAVMAAAAFGAYWLVFGGDGDSADDTVRRLAVLRAQAAALPQVEAALTALRVQAEAQPGLLQGESDAVSQSAMQSDLKSLIEANGGEVRSAFALPPDAADGLALLSVQFDLTLPVSKLRGLIYAIESHVPYLFLSAVDIAAPQAWPSDPKAAEPRVEVRWTVSGYRQKELP